MSRSCPLATRRASRVSGLASKPVWRIAVFALLVPAPTSAPPSISAMRKSKRASSRAIADPTSPAPTMPTSYESVRLEGDRALNELAPLRMRALPPLVVAGGLDPIPGRGSVRELHGGIPDAGADRRRGRQRGRIGGQAEVAAEPFEQCAGGEHAPVDRPLHLAVDPPSDGGEEAALGLRAHVAGMGEDEHAGAVGRLDPSRHDAPGAGERGLLIDSPRSKRQVDRP